MFVSIPKRLSEVEKREKNTDKDMADPDDDVFADASKTEGSFDVDDKTIDESIDGQDSVSYILNTYYYSGIHINI